MKQDLKLSGSAAVAAATQSIHDGAVRSKISTNWCPSRLELLELPLKVVLKGSAKENDHAQLTWLASAR